MKGDVTMLEVSECDPQTLIPDPANVRTHDPRNKAAVMRSLKRFGIRKPIVAHQQTKVVYAGNLTLEVALELGYESVPVAWIPADVPREVCQAYAIADNRASDLSAFDETALRELMKVLENQPEIDIIDTGFDPEALENTFADEFLSAFIDDETPTDESSRHNETDYVKLNFLLLPDERETVVEVLNAIKESETLTSHAQSLVSLCTQWKREHSSSPSTSSH